MDRRVLRTPIMDNEYWWGGSVNMGYKMPLGKDGGFSVNLDEGRECDQFAPVFLSSKGRFIWSDRPFNFEAISGEIRCTGRADIELYEGAGDLKGAYLAAMKERFPFTGAMPDGAFFTAPQYNTWIELETKQTSDNILRYAKGIIAHGLPAGILMIDEGWQEDYGIFEFNKSKIPDPASLIYELHQMGFKVMLWVTPMVAAAGPTFKDLEKRGFLLKDAKGDTAIREWWNGFSAIIDLDNPQAADWYDARLKSLQKRYGVDGFKFDAGDVYMYRDDDGAGDILARERTMAFNALGERYPLNEFRAAWKFGARPIVARLHDKNHAWNGFGLDTLIPNTIMQGLLGYIWCCPDMVGGGQINSFNGGQKPDGELVVRWAQANCYMSMMQMSISPWRILEGENLELTLDALKRHAQNGGLFLELAKASSRSGEPIVRPMAYDFPNEGLETATGQFMLGENLLVAPVLEKGARVKEVRLPKGAWRGWNGEIYAGGAKIAVPVTMRDIPTFTREK